MNPMMRYGSPRILVVEDNATNREFVVALLEQGGCEVLVAETAEAGLLLSRAEPPDLVLMDLQLPAMSGYEAVRQLKSDRATASIPVVALTAQAMRGDEARAREAGCDAYLTKPVDTQLFWETLDRFLRQAASGQGWDTVEARARSQVRQEPDQATGNSGGHGGSGGR
jgi:CheY-like chemotaxis protein